MGLQCDTTELSLGNIKGKNTDNFKISILVTYLVHIVGETSFGVFTRFLQQNWPDQATPTVAINCTGVLCNSAGLTSI